MEATKVKAFTNFVGDFFLGSDLLEREGVKIFDKTMIVPLDDERNAEITLSTRRVADQYEKFTVTIIHKKTGKIAQHSFHFSDYMDFNKQDPKTTGQPMNRYYHVWENNGKVDWYIAIPASSEIDRMIKAITDYIDSYK